MNEEQKSLTGKEIFELYELGKAMVRVTGPGMTNTDHARRHELWNRNTAQCKAEEDTCPKENFEDAFKELQVEHEELTGSVNALKTALGLEDLKSFDDLAHKIIDLTSDPCCCDAARKLAKIKDLPGLSGSGDDVSASERVKSLIKTYKTALDTNHKLWRENKALKSDNDALAPMEEKLQETNRIIDALTEKNARQSQRHTNQRERIADLLLGFANMKTNIDNALEEAIAQIKKG